MSVALDNVREFRPTGAANVREGLERPQDVKYALPQSLPARSHFETWVHNAYIDAEVGYHFEACFPSGNIGSINSVTGAGKSMLALTLAVSAASGETILPMFKPTTARPVIYVGENPERLEYARLKAIAALLPSDDARDLAYDNLSVITGHCFPLFVREGNNIELTEAGDQLRDSIWRAKAPAAFVVLDPLGNFVGKNGVKLTSDDDMMPVMDILRDAVMLESSGMDAPFLLLVHHVPKDREKALIDGETVGYGSSYISNAQRLAFNLTKPTKTEMQRYGVKDVDALAVLRMAKNNYGRKWDPIYLHRDPETGVFTEAKPTAKKGKQQVADMNSAAKRFAELIGANEADLSIQKITEKPDGKALRTELGVSVRDAKDIAAHAIAVGLVVVDEVSFRGGTRQVPREAATHE